jgi:hypothetical protein
LASFATLARTNSNEEKWARAKGAKDAKVQTAWEIAHAVVEFAFELHHEQLQWLEEFSILFGEDESYDKATEA